MSVDPNHEPNLEALFNPKSIALVGATDKSPWSVNTFRNLKDGGFGGDLYLVNRTTAMVHGEKAYESLADLPAVVDLVFVMVPTAVVLPVLKEAVAHGARAAVVLTAGFGETGAEGKMLEDEIVAFCRSTGLTVLGPNGNGYINATQDIAPYGLPIVAPFIVGSVGVVLQSGALVTTVMQFAQSQNIGISFLTAMGNESMMSVTDVMDHLVDDPDTKVIALFLESVRNPREFSRVCRRAIAAGKPIVAFKIGRSALGATTARSHTGALVGDDEVVSAAFEQLGVIRTSSLEDLMITAGLLAHTGPLPGRRLGVITPSGGGSEIIADRAEDEALELPEFAPETVRQLSAIVPDFATVSNPLDVTGYVVIDPSLMRRSLEVVANDPGVDIAVLLTEIPRTTPADISRAHVDYRLMAQAIMSTPIPTIVMNPVLSDITEAGREVQEATGFPFLLGGIEHGLPAIARAITWSETYREFTRREPSTAVERDLGDCAPASKAVWVEHEASRFLDRFDIPTVPLQLANTADEAVKAADDFGYPVVLKAVADGLAHKSDIGGVKLNLTSADDVRRAHDGVVAALTRSGATGICTLVQPQRSAEGVEMLVGVVRDPAWGATMAIGLGGVWVEVLNDTKLLVLPTSQNEIRTAIEGLRAAKLLTGARGTDSVDLDLLVSVIARIGDIAYRLGDRLQALEINPLMVRGSQVEALDALIVWDD